MSDYLFLFLSSYIRVSLTSRALLQNISQQQVPGSIIYPAIRSLQTSYIQSLSVYIVYVYSQLISDSTNSPFGSPKTYCGHTLRGDRCFATLTFSFHFFFLFLLFFYDVSNCYVTLMLAGQVLRLTLSSV